MRGSRATNVRWHIAAFALLLAIIFGVGVTPVASQTGVLSYSSSSVTWDGSNGNSFYIQASFATSTAGRNHATNVFDKCMVCNADGTAQIAMNTVVGQPGCSCVDYRTNVYYGFLDPSMCASALDKISNLSCALNMCAAQVPSPIDSDPKSCTNTSSPTYDYDADTTWSTCTSSGTCGLDGVRTRQRYCYKSGTITANAVFNTSVATTCTDGQPEESMTCVSGTASSCPATYMCYNNADASKAPVACASACNCETGVAEHLGQTVGCFVNGVYAGATCPYPANNTRPAIANLTCSANSCPYRCGSTAGSLDYVCSNSLSTAAYTTCSTTCGINGSRQTYRTCTNAFGQAAGSNAPCTNTAVLPTSLTQTCADFSASTCFMAWRCDVSGVFQVCTGLDACAATSTYCGTPARPTFNALCRLDNNGVVSTIANTYCTSVVGSAPAPAGGNCPDGTFCSFSCRTSTNPTLTDCSDAMWSTTWPATCSSEAGCGSGTRTREVRCISGSNNYASNDVRCSSRTQPMTTQVCYGSGCAVQCFNPLVYDESTVAVANTMACSNSTSAGHYGCPTTCGYGTFVTDAVCIGRDISSNPVVLPLNDQQCINSRAPYDALAPVPSQCMDTSTCVPGGEDAPHWRCLDGTTPYCPNGASWCLCESQCTELLCGDGTMQLRGDLVCILGGQVQTNQTICTSYLGAFNYAALHIGEACRANHCDWNCVRDAAGFPKPTDVSNTKYPAVNAVDVLVCEDDTNCFSCTSGCGTGNQSRTCNCVLRNGNPIDDSYCAENPQTRPPATGGSCELYVNNATTCPLDWRCSLPATPSTLLPCDQVCSTTCGTGNRGNAPTCVVSFSNGTVVTLGAEYCTEYFAAPDVSEGTCSRTSCPYLCRAGEGSPTTACPTVAPTFDESQPWTAVAPWRCNEDCGTGTLSTEVVCNAPAPTGLTTDFTWCLTNAAPVPPTRTCTDYVDNNGDCDVMWRCNGNQCTRTCSMTCGPGEWQLTESPESCYVSSAGGAWTSIHSGYCNVAWKDTELPAGLNTECRGNACTIGCGVPTAVEADVSIAVLSSCDAMGSIGDWTLCSATCGDGSLLTRSACVNSLDVTGRVVYDSSYCVDSTSPNPGYTVVNVTDDRLNTSVACRDFSAAAQGDPTCRYAFACRNTAGDFVPCTDVCSVECGNGVNVLPGAGTPVCVTCAATDGVCSYETMQAADIVANSYCTGTGLQTPVANGTACIGGGCGYLCQNPTTPSAVLRDCMDSNLPLDYYKPCSNSCGDGTRVIQPVCVIDNSNPSAPVIDSAQYNPHCAHATLPSRPQIPCTEFIQNAATCNITYRCYSVTGGWDADCLQECGLSCGASAMQFRSGRMPYCSADKGSGVVVQIPSDSVCTGLSLVQPTTGTYCVGGQCAWKCSDSTTGAVLGDCASTQPTAPHWSRCSNQCGNGLLETYVVCVDTAANTVYVEGSDEASVHCLSAAPSVPDVACEVYAPNVLTGNDFCGVEWECDLGGGEDLVPCDPVCSQSCGVGTTVLSGTPVCRITVGTAAEISRDDDACALVTRPSANAAPCNDGLCPWKCRVNATAAMSDCEADEDAPIWSGCSNNCGEGTLVTDRVCLNNNTNAVEDSSYCANTPVPSYSVPCSEYAVGTCQISWRCEQSDGSFLPCERECSKECGDSVQRNNGAPQCHTYNTLTSTYTSVDFQLCKDIIPTAQWPVLDGDAPVACKGELCPYMCRHSDYPMFNIYDLVDCATVADDAAGAPYWSDCSVACYWTGTKSKDVVCVNSDTVPWTVHELADNAHCARSGDAPTQTVNCFSYDGTNCAVQWGCEVSGAHETCTRSCNKACGDGYFELNGPVKCFISDNGGALVRVPDAYNTTCAGIAAPAGIPANGPSAVCDGGYCNHRCHIDPVNHSVPPFAQTGDCQSESQWGNCDAVCGAGVKHTVSKCYEGSTLRDDTYCRNTVLTLPTPFICEDFTTCAEWLCGGVACAAVCAGDCGLRTTVYNAAPECFVSGVKTTNTTICSTYAAPLPAIGSSCNMKKCPWYCRKDVTSTPGLCDSAKEVTNVWGTCSNSCGVGTLQTNYVCYNSYVGSAAVDASYCDNTPQSDYPIAQHGCAQYSCAVAWKCRDSWDTAASAYNTYSDCTPQCNTTCGTSHQVYQGPTLCIVGGSISSNVTVCEESAAALPALASVCTGRNCPWGCQSFDVPASTMTCGSGMPDKFYGTCSNSCGSGQRAANVICLVPEGDADPANAAHCADVAKPSPSSIACTNYVHNAGTCPLAWFCYTSGGTYESCSQVCTETCGDGYYLLNGLPRCTVRVGGSEQPLTDLTVQSASYSAFCGAQGSQVPPSGTSEICKGLNCPFACKSNSSMTLYDCTNDSSHNKWYGCSNGCGVGTQITSIGCHNTKSSVWTALGDLEAGTDYCANSAAVTPVGPACENYGSKCAEWQCEYYPDATPENPTAGAMATRECALVCSVDCSVGEDVLNGDPHCYVSGVRQATNTICLNSADVTPLPTTGGECWGKKCPFKCRPVGSSQLFECDDEDNIFGGGCDNGCGAGNKTSEIVCFDSVVQDLNSTLCSETPAVVLPVVPCVSYSGTDCSRSWSCLVGGNIVPCTSTCDSTCGAGTYFYNGVPVCLVNDVEWDGTGSNPCNIAPAPTLDHLPTGACVGEACPYVCENPNVNSTVIDVCSNEDVFDGCSASCGPGTKLTNIVCAEPAGSGGFTPVDSTYCRLSTMPTLSPPSCNGTTGCGNVSWMCRNSLNNVVACVKSCSVTCGLGTFVRNGDVGCYQNTESGYVEVASASCSSIAMPESVGEECVGDRCPYLCRPGGSTDVPQTCNSAPANSPATWSSCSTSCGEGTRTSQVVCYNAAMYPTNTSDIFCAATDKPQLIPAYDAATSTYSVACSKYDPAQGCSVIWQCLLSGGTYADCTAACGATCGSSTVVTNGTPTCLVNNVVTNSSVCQNYLTGPAMPAYGQACNMKQCDYACRSTVTNAPYVSCDDTSIWSTCSTNCGNGTETRRVYCYVSSTNSYQTSLDNCVNNGFPQPSTTRSCEKYVYNVNTCNIHWRCKQNGANTWGTCEARCQTSCGASTTALYYSGDTLPTDQPPACYVGSTLVPDTVCLANAASQVPTYGEVCDLKKCPWRCAVPGAPATTNQACSTLDTAPIWSSCSETCGFGTRTTQLHCTALNGNVIADQSACANSVRPTETIPCSETSLCPQWLCDGQPCEQTCSSCGVGTMIYTNGVLGCYYNGTKQASETYCTSRGVTKPATNVECSPRNCPYMCYDNNSTLSLLHDCANTTAPIWGACSGVPGGYSCGVGRQNVTRTCSNGLGAPVAPTWCENAAVVPPLDRACVATDNCGAWSCGTSTSAVVPCQTTCETQCGYGQTVYTTAQQPRCLYKGAFQTGGNIDKYCPTGFPALTACSDVSGCAWGCRNSTGGTVATLVACTDDGSGSGWSVCDNANKCGDGQTTTVPTCFDSVRNVIVANQTLCSTIPGHGVSSSTRTCSITTGCGSWLCYDGFVNKPTSCVRTCPSGCGASTDYLESSIGCFTFDSLGAPTLRTGSDKDIFCADGVAQTPIPVPEPCTATDKCTWKCGLASGSSSATVGLCQPLDYWPSCPTACGVAEVERTVVCTNTANTTAVTPVADSLCASAGTKPVNKTECEVFSGCTFSWKCASLSDPTNFNTCDANGADFSSCSTTCGTGTKTRVVKCFDHLNQQRAETLCTTAKPAVSASCDDMSSCSYEWACYSNSVAVRDVCASTGTWGVCSASCGVGTQSRSAVCVSNGGAIQSNLTLCASAGVAPVVSRECSSGTSCLYTYSAWSACSHTCLTAADTLAGVVSRKTRTATCTTSTGAVTVDYSLCASKPAPTLNGTCSVPACGAVSPPEWVATGWSSTCYGRCGANAEVRKVSCKTTDTQPAVTVDDSLCSAATRPANTRACSTVTVQENPCSQSSISSFTSGSCVLETLVAENTTYTGTQVGFCVCANGFVGTYCSSRPRITNVRLTDLGTAPIVVQGTTRSVAWEYIGADTLGATIVLYKSGSDFGTPVGTVTHASANAFSWTVAEDLVGGRYFLEVYASAICSARSAVFDVDSVCNALDCGDHGVCNASDGTCTCTGNYTGTLCTTSPCDRARCHPAGTASCTDGVCSCLTDIGGTPLFTGARCLTPAVCNIDTNAPVCVNGGVNTAGAGDSCGACSCEGSWGGDTCATCQLACVSGTVSPDCTTCTCPQGIHSALCACRHMHVGLHFALTRTPWWDTDPSQQRVWLRTLLYDVASLITLSGDFPRGRVRVENVTTTTIYNVTYRTVTLNIAGACAAPHEAEFVSEAGFMSLSLDDTSYLASSPAIYSTSAWATASIDGSTVAMSSSPSVFRTKSLGASTLHADDVTMWDLYGYWVDLKTIMSSSTGAVGSVLATMQINAGVTAVDVNCKSGSSCPTGIAATAPGIVTDPDETKEVPSSPMSGSSVSGDMTLIGALIGVAVAVVLLAGCLIFLLCFRRKKRRQRDDEADAEAQALADASSGAAAAGATAAGAGVYAGAAVYASAVAASGTASPLAQGKSLQERMREAKRGDDGDAGDVMHIRVRPGASVAPAPVSPDVDDDALPSDASSGDDDDVRSGAGAGGKKQFDLYAAQNTPKPSQKRYDLYASQFKA